MEKIKIVALAVSDKDFYIEKEVFGARDDVEFIISGARSKADVIENIKDAEVILFTDIKIDKEVIDKAKECKLIIRYGIGYDNVDVSYAKEKGIFVCNAPNYGVLDVAEHALSLILSTAKRLTYMNDCVRECMWDTTRMGKSIRLSGKTIGFLGFGKIARALCKMTNALGMKAIVYDPYVDGEALAFFGAEAVSLDALLESADYVTLHLPLNEKTKHTITKNELSKMKKTAILINTGRGGLVKEEDLISALNEGLIAGAGLDVFENEAGGLDKSIFYHKKIALTPHVAWNTEEATDAIHREVTDNVLKYLSGKEPDSIVNR
jgi:D-3-phosphoglycerate dehydrogenase